MPQTRVGQPKLIVAGPFGAAQTGTTFQAIGVPAGSYIPPYGVTLNVTTVLAGGTPLIDVGDTDDPNGWLDQGENDPANYAQMYCSGLQPYAINGKYYTAAGAINVVLSASLTSGEFYVIAEIYDVEDVL